MREIHCDTGNQTQNRRQCGNVPSLRLRTDGNQQQRCTQHPDQSRRKRQLAGAIKRGADRAGDRGR